ncbi:MAG: cysteine desulfurase [Flavobacteriaceae bacterium]|nr:cysteine desulfurase [Flavobacteriaceae bacterium]
MQKIYFDSAATTAIDKDVISIITKTMASTYGNPSSSHQFGRSARALVEQSRKNIAQILNCSATEIVFTAGGSEADNLILFNAVKNLGVRRIISSKIAHHAILHTIKVLENDFDIKVDFVDLNKDAEVDINHLSSLLEDKSYKTLVSLMLVNNELGNILDVDQIVNICKKNDALFHSDTVQGIAHVPIDLQKTPIDFIAASAHKFHGPKGVGFAVFKKGFGISPLLHGGEQERGARAGTENIHSIIGMEKALSIATKHFDEHKKYINSLKQYFITKLKENFKDISFNGKSDDLEKSAFHILNVRFNKDYPMLLFNLDLKGIAASGGSACQSGSNKGSHVLHAILSEEESLKTSVRFSFSKYNTKDEIDYVIDVLKELLRNNLPF